MLVKADKPRSPPSPKKRKRRYRRHPKADTHGPKHPLSAYVLFANDLRKNLGDTQLSFTQLSQRVGESWQLLGSEEPSEWKIQAAITRGIYLQDLEKYKKTGEYREYQRYLADFKHKSRFGQNRRPRQRPLSRNSSNASIDADQIGKSSGGVENWLQTDPSSCPSNKSQASINSDTTCRQTLREEDIDATQHGNIRSFNIPCKELSTLPRPPVLDNGLGTGSLVLPPRILSHAVPLQAKHRHGFPHAIQPSVLVCGTGQQRPDGSVKTTSGCDTSTNSQFHQPCCALCPFHSHPRPPISAGIANIAVSDRNESAGGNGSGYSSRQEHGQELVQHRGGYFETVLQSSGGGLALGLGS
jgi:hypothetical protein